MEAFLAKLFVKLGAASGAATFGFAGFLLLLLAITGLVWLLDKFLLRNSRKEEAKQPWWVEYSISFFPVIFFGSA